MKVLIACEFSGVVRDAFRNCGHDAVSCDLLPTERPGPHFQCDIRELDLERYDLVIAHPPCTHLCCSGAAWFEHKMRERWYALEFIKFFFECPAPMVAIENPVGIISTVFRKPDQIIQPYEFGDPYSKATCLWLKGLPLLQPTNIVDRGERWVSATGSGKSMARWYISASSKERGVTFPGIAEAMAVQWTPRFRRAYLFPRFHLFPRF